MEYVLTADALTKKYKNFNTYSDCYRSGFSPDSLFIDCASQRQPNRNASVKVHKFFPRKQQIYTQKFPVLENF